MAEITPQPALVLSDRPLKTKLVEEIRSIALEMQLAIAKDPRWEPLLAHRSHPKVGAKTSAEKAVEEAVEAAKPQLPVTGAHRTLLAENVKTDPPGQYKKLPSIPGSKEKALSVSDSDSDSESTPASLGHQSAPQTPETKPLVLNATGIQEKSTLIQVNFFNERNFAAAPRQVYVEHPVRIVMGDDGQPKYLAQLSRLIPAAVEQDSPIKDRGGRLYRPNIRDDSTQHLHIGTIDAVVAGTSQALRPTAVNDYVMHDAGAGLACDLFWDEGTGDGGIGAVANSLTLNNNKDSVAGADANDMLQIENSSVGSNMTITPLREEKPVTTLQLPTDKPLDVARNRAAQDPMHRDAPPELRAEFACDLHKRVKGEVPSLPDFGEEWPRCMFAGQMRARFQNQQAAFKYFEPFGGSLGAYALPRSNSLWPGVRFKKEFLYKEVLNIRSSATTDIDKCFTEAMLEGAPKAKAWVESDGGENGKKFDKMKTVDFKNYLKDRAKRDPNPRKHRKSSSDEDGSRRRRRRMNSEELDKSDSSA
ncbi:hypothetical protein C8R45DRAFT_1216629 [Mycena sanguinolenta]|nr:hypothetical protein C8R45DRAFT_1216629 [Mycena sanguinolenta]